MAIHHLSHGRTFDSITGEVRCGDHVVRLEPQPAALLELLVARAGDLVSHAEIRDGLWGDGRHVAYHAGVHYAVRQVRRALDARGPHADIETIPRRGYRLRVESVDASDALIEPRAPMVDVSKHADRSGGTIDPTPPPTGAAMSDGDGRSNANGSVAASRRRRVLRIAAAAGLALAIVASERRPNSHHEIAVTVARAVHQVLFER